MVTRTGSRLEIDVLRIIVMKNFEFLWFYELNIDDFNIRFKSFITLS